MKEKEITVNRIIAVMEGVAAAKAVMLGEKKDIVRNLKNFRKIAIVKGNYLRGRKSRLRFYYKYIKGVIPGLTQEKFVNVLFDPTKDREDTMHRRVYSSPKDCVTNLQKGFWIEKIKQLVLNDDNIFKHMVEYSLEMRRFERTVSYRMEDEFYVKMVDLAVENKNSIIDVLINRSIGCPPATKYILNEAKTRDKIQIMSICGCNFYLNGGLKVSRNGELVE